MEDKKTYYKEDLIDGAIEELDDVINWFKKEKDDSYYIDDIITEVADNNIPIYTDDLLQYARYNYDLNEPSDLSGDNASVTSIISANIYELLIDALYKHKEEKNYE